MISFNAKKKKVYVNEKNYSRKSRLESQEMLRTFALYQSSKH